MKTTFTILHTNDMHSNFIGMGPASDYTPFTLNVVTGIETSGRDERLYSVTTPLMLGVILVGIPKYTKGKLSLAPKNRQGQPLTSRVEALDAPHENSGFLLAPPGKVDSTSVAVGAANGAVREIKGWQAIMDHLRSLPAGRNGGLPVISVDARASEVRTIRAG
jgi:5'-nucleotidase/UDP-sugar diphosphatase